MDFCMGILHVPLGAAGFYELASVARGHAVRVHLPTSAACDSAVADSRGRAGLATLDTISLRCDALDSNALLFCAAGWGEHDTEDWRTGWCHTPPVGWQRTF